MINVTCQACGKNFKLRDELAGREGKCPCGAVLVIPSAEMAATTLVKSAGQTSRPATIVSTFERQPIQKTDQNTRLPNTSSLESVKAATKPLKHNKELVAPANFSPTPKGRSKKQLLIFAGTALALIAVALAAVIVFVEIPNHRKMQETLGAAVKQMDTVEAMRKKADAQREAQLAAELAAATAQQTGSVSGEVWIEKTSGETLSLASEDVYLFPSEIKTDGPHGKFHDGIATLQIPIETAANLPGNAFAVAGGQDAEKNLNPLKPFIDSPMVPSIAVINGSIAVAALKADDSYAKRMRKFGDPSVMEDSIASEPFWALIAAQSLNQVKTSREGKFLIDDCPPGNYVLACRANKPSLGAVVYWGQKIAVLPGKATKFDLTSSNAVVVSY